MRSAVRLSRVVRRQVGTPNRRRLYAAAVCAGATIRPSPTVTASRSTRLPEPCGKPLVPCRAGGRLLSRLRRRGVATPDCCSHAPPAAPDVSAAPLAPGHPREGGQALDRSAAADALPLEAALLHLDTDFELHRLSHRPGDAAVSRPTTRRVLVVRCGREMSAVGCWSPRQSRRRVLPSAQPRDTGPRRARAGP